MAQFGRPGGLPEVGQFEQPAVTNPHLADIMVQAPQEVSLPEDGQTDVHEN
jgi:hypothetical protein